jgi:hypothetical protein
MESLERLRYDRMYSGLTLDAPGQRQYGSVGQIMPFFEGKVSLIHF